MLRDKNQPEYILCAAIWFVTDRVHVHQPINTDKGFVLCGHRHCSIFGQVLLSVEKRINGGVRKEIQGFLTSKNRFVEREEAAIIAFKAGQIEHEIKLLYSGNLY